MYYIYVCNVFNVIHFKLEYICIPYYCKSTVLEYPYNSTGVL